MQIVECYIMEDSTIHTTRRELHERQSSTCLFFATGTCGRLTFGIDIPRFYISTLIYVPRKSFENNDFSAAALPISN
jgi:hypothetical protein